MSVPLGIVEKGLGKPDNSYIVRLVKELDNESLKS